MDKLNRKLFHPSCAVAVAFALAACTGSDLVNPQVTPPGSSIAFADGYSPGCLSGFTDANRTGYENTYSKDAGRYATDGEYRAGWDKGHDACYLEEQLRPRIKGEGSNRMG
jgi:hypothetical protein